MQKNPSIESIARAWASIDGKLERFDNCKADLSLDDTDGSYSGYIADTEELMRRAYKYEED